VWWQAHRPFFNEWPCRETCWYVCWPHRVPVAPPAPIPGCGQRKHCQHIGLCTGFIWYYLFFFLLILVYWSMSWPASWPCVTMYSYCLLNPFCKLHCSIRCAVLLCALVNYLVNRTAYDEATVWCYVPYFLHSAMVLNLFWPTDYVLKNKIQWTNLLCLYLNN